MLPALAPLTLIFGFVKLLLFFRANAMRALASRWGFQYIGPPALRLWSLWFRSSPEIRPPLPVSFSLAGYPANRITAVWNVIEGQQSGVSVLIFDSYLGKVKGTYYRVQDRKECLRNRCLGRSRNTVGWMGSPLSNSAPSNSSVDNEHTAPRRPCE